MTPILPDKMSFMEHLGELRVRIVRSLVALLVGLAIALPLSQRLTDYLAKPIQATGNTLVFLAVTEAFWVQMKVAVIAGLFIASPGILWQVWRFVSPGLYQHEKKYAMPFVDAGRVQPDVDGGAPHPPLRGGDHLRPHLRSQAEAGARRRGDTGLARWTLPR